MLRFLFGVAASGCCNVCGTANLVSKDFGGRERPFLAVVFALHCLLISHFAGSDNTGFPCTFGTHRLSPGSAHALGKIDLNRIKSCHRVGRPTCNGN